MHKKRCTMIKHTSQEVSAVIFLPLPFTVILILLPLKNLRQKPSKDLVLHLASLCNHLDTDVNQDFSNLDKMNRKCGQVQVTAEVRKWNQT